MPLTDKGKKILTNMRELYGKRAERVFYASRNKGTISGVDRQSRRSGARKKG
jgi:hypothetical protein